MTDSTNHHQLEQLAKDYLKLLDSEQKNENGIHEQTEYQFSNLEKSSLVSMREFFVLQLKSCKCLFDPFEKLIKSYLYFTHETEKSPLLTIGVVFCSLLIARNTENKKQVNLIQKIVFDYIGQLSKKFPYESDEKRNSVVMQLNFTLLLWETTHKLTPHVALDLSQFDWRYRNRLCAAYYCEEFERTKNIDHAWHFFQFVKEHLFLNIEQSYYNVTITNYIFMMELFYANEFKEPFVFFQNMINSLYHQNKFFGSPSCAKMKFTIFNFLCKFSNTIIKIYTREKELSLIIFATETIKNIYLEGSLPFNYYHALIRKYFIPLQVNKKINSLKIEIIEMINLSNNDPDKIEKTIDDTLLSITS